MVCNYRIDGHPSPRALPLGWVVIFYGHKFWILCWKVGFFSNLIGQNMVLDPHMVSMYRDHALADCEGTISSSWLKLELQFMSTFLLVNTFILHFWSETFSMSQHTTDLSWWMVSFSISQAHYWPYGTINLPNQLGEHMHSQWGHTHHKWSPWIESSGI